MKEPTMMSVSVSSLKLADDNVRSELGDLAELAATIKQHGVLEPLLVDEATMVVVAGARRLEAAKLAKLKTVPAIVRTFSDRERLEVMLIENLQREGLSPIEEAHGFQRLKELGLSQRDIAAKVGRPVSHVNTRLQLLKLPEKVQQQVDAGKVQLQQAAELVKVAGDEELVTRLAANAARGSSNIAYEVQQAKERAEREKKQRETMKALKAKGENVVEIKADKWGYNPETPAGMLEVRKEAYFAHAVEMDPAEHAKLPCHAVGVHPRTFETIHLCTDPKSHPDPRKEREKAEAKRREQAEKERLAAEAALQHQLEFLRTVGMKPSKEQVLDVAYLALRQDSDVWYGRQTGWEVPFVLGLTDLHGEPTHEFATELGISVDAGEQPIEEPEVKTYLVDITYAGQDGDTDAVIVQAKTEDEAVQIALSQSGAAEGSTANAVEAPQLEDVPGSLNGEPAEEEPAFDLEVEVEKKVEAMAASGGAAKLRVTFAFAVATLLEHNVLDVILDELGYEPPAKSKGRKKEEEPAGKSAAAA
jgi:ParB/RepB/Spo0J family partition protein